MLCSEKERSGWIYSYVHPYMKHVVVRCLHSAGQCRNLMLHFSRVEMWGVEVSSAASLMRVWHVQSHHLTICPACAFLHPPLHAIPNTTKPHMLSWVWMSADTFHWTSHRNTYSKHSSTTCWCQRPTAQKNLTLNNTLLQSSFSAFNDFFPPPQWNLIDLA